MFKLKRNSVIPGIIVITVGTLFLLQNTGFDLGFKIADLWPAVFVFIGLWHLFKPTGRNLLKSIIFIAIGIFLIFKNFGYIDYGFEVIWPVLIILAGLIIFFGSAKSKDHSDCRDKISSEMDEDLINLSLSLSGSSYFYNSQNFKGGAVSLVMGSCDIDLKKADLKTNNTILDVSLLMGEINIFIPVNWKVNLQISPVLADVKDNTKFEEIKGKESKTLIVKGSVIMGGIGIKN